MDETNRAGRRARERKIERLVANIVARILRQAAAESIPAKCCVDLASGKGRACGIRCSWKDRAGRRAAARGIAMKLAQTVQRPRFDAESFLAGGEAEMDNGIGLEHFVELFEFSRGLAIIDRQYAKFEFDAEACQSCLMAAKCVDQQRCWVTASVRKAAEAGNEDAERRHFLAEKAQTALCTIAKFSSSDIRSVTNLVSSLFLICS